MSPGERSNFDDTNTFPADTGKAFWRMFPSIALPIYMSVGDQTIVASALPAIAGALGDVERVSWVFIGYLIASTIAAPVYGYLGDVFGRRKLLIIALAIFMVGSVLNTLAPSVILLSASRFLQGLGGGGMMSMCQALMAEVVPPRERGRYQGYTATVFVVAAALGPVIGAFLTLQFGWRAVFFINIPVGIFAFVLIFRLPNRQAPPSDGWHFDYRGLFYFTAFVVPLLLALEQVRRFNMAGSLLMVALAVISAVSLYLLIRQQRQAKSPLLPMALMRLPTIWNCQLMILCHGAMMTALIAFLPLYMRVSGLGTIHDVGFMLLVYSFAIALSSIFVGRMVTRTGYTMIFPSIGMCVTTFMFIYIALFAPSLSLRGLYLTIFFLAIAMGTVMTVSQVTIQAVAGRRQLGAASGSVQLARTVGAVFGTALFGTVLFALLAFHDREAAASFGRLLNLGPEALQAYPADRRAAIMAEIASGFRWGYFLLAAIAAISTLLALTNPTRRL